MFKTCARSFLTGGVSAAFLFLAVASVSADLTVAPDFPVAGRPAGEQRDAVGAMISDYARDVKVVEPVPEDPAKKAGSDAEVVRER
jgi:hypothetical protein